MVSWYGSIKGEDLFFSLHYLQKETIIWLADHVACQSIGLFIIHVHVYPNIGRPFSYTCIFKYWTHTGHVNEGNTIGLYLLLIHSRMWYDRIGATEALLQKIAMLFDEVRYVHVNDTIKSSDQCQHQDLIVIPIIVTRTGNYG